MTPAWIVLAPLAVALWLLAEPWWRARRRDQLRARPFPGAWRAILRRNVAHYRFLPPVFKRRLEQHVQVFLAEKAFAGCAGQEVDDEVRVTVAGQASLLLLGHAKATFPRLTSILVYPGAFVVERLRPEPSGVLQEQRQALSGESWTQGQVILSWDDTLGGGLDPHDGRNVVIHEFAHQLDQQKGYANGAPGLPSRARRERWSRVLGEEFARLRAMVAMGEATLIDPYGASAPEEFFAVASEVFFERPHAMAALHPALYAELRGLYGVDPASWVPAISAPAPHP